MDHNSALYSSNPSYSLLFSAKFLYTVKKENSWRRRIIFADFRYFISEVVIAVCDYSGGLSRLMLVNNVLHPFIGDRGGTHHWCLQYPPTSSPTLTATFLHFNSIYCCFLKLHFTYILSLERMASFQEYHCSDSRRSRIVYVLVVIGWHHYQISL